MKSFFVFLIFSAWCGATCWGQMLTNWGLHSYPNASVNGALVAVDSSGNTYVCYSVRGPNSVWVTKFDPQGLPIWGNRYGLQGGSEWARPDYMFFKDDYLWILGNERDLQAGIDQDLFVRKIDTLGNEAMAFFYRNPDFDFTMAYDILPNGNLLITNSVWVNAYIQRCHLLCYAAGDSVLLWDFVPGGNETSNFPGSVEHDLNGDIYMFYGAYVGQTMHYYIVKVSPNGNLIRKIDRVYTAGICFSGFAPNGTILLSETDFGGGSSKFIHIDSAGNTLWENNSYGVTAGNSGANATADHGWIVPGIASGDGTILRLDSAGNELWRVSVPDNYGGDIWAMGGTFSPDSSMYYAFYYGSVLNTGSTHDFYVARISLSGVLIDVTILTNPPRNDQFQGFSYSFKPDGNLVVFLDRNNALNYSDRHKMLYCLCTNDCAPNVSGVTFYDFDANCIQSVNEPAFPYSLLNVDQSSGYLMSNGSGYYASLVASGVHSLKQELPIYLNNTCPAAAYNFTIDSLSPTAFGLDFGVVIDSTYHDMAVDMYHFPNARPGFNQVHSISCNNNGITADSGTVMLVLDSVFQFISATPPPTSVVGNHFYWDYAPVQPFLQQQIMVTTSVSSLTPLGTPFTNIATIGSAFLDVEPNNNEDTLKGQIVGSYDPNHKSAFPSGPQPDGKILISDTLLTYTIDFQNLGTDTAFTVKIKDTISPNLDLRTLRVVNASHDWDMALLGDRTILWTFSAINLPDVGHNALLSNGFIRYQIKRMPGLPLNTSITNRAHIYFDFNGPISTNLFNSTIRDSSWVGVAGNVFSPTLKVYPNPAGSLLVLKLNYAYDGSEVDIIDGTGRSFAIKATVGTTKEELLLDVSSLSSGIYLLLIESEGKRQGIRWIKQ